MTEYEYPQPPPPATHERPRGGGGMYPIWILVPLVTVRYLFAIALHVAERFSRREVGPALVLTLSLLAYSFLVRPSALGLLAALAVLASDLALAHVDWRKREPMVSVALVFAVWVTVSIYFAAAVGVLVLFWLLRNRVPVSMLPSKKRDDFKDRWMEMLPAVFGRDAQKIGVGRVKKTKYGFDVENRVSHGIHIEDHRMNGPVTAHMQARSIQFVRSDHNAGLVTAKVFYRDPVAESSGRWQDARSVWDGIVVGIDEHGEDVTLDLVYNSLLIGGMPGTGKSGILQMVVATGAADPRTRLFLIDGKTVELGHWKDHAERFAAQAKDAIAILRHVQTEMEERLHQIHRLPGVRRKILRTDDYQLLLVVIDELSCFTATGEPGRDEFDSVLGDLVKRGRAAGVIVVCATQRPGVDVISGQVRGNMGLRWALRTADVDGTRMILGRSEPPAHELPHAPGIGYLTRETGYYRKLRTYYLSDADIERLIARPRTG